MVSRSSYYRAPAAERFVIAAAVLGAFVGDIYGEVGNQQISINQLLPLGRRVVPNH